MTAKTETSEPMVLVEPDAILPEGQRFWLHDSMFATDKDGQPIPHFKVKEVAEVFFGKSSDWMRWRMRPDERKVKDPETGEFLRDADGEFVKEPGPHPEGYFVLDGQALDFKRTGPGARYFTLADIERMAHALAQGGHIDGSTLNNVVQMVRICAKIHGVILP